MLPGSLGVAFAGPWLWTLGHGPAPYGSVFRTDLASDATAQFEAGKIGPMRPSRRFIKGLDLPEQVVVSGDYLYITNSQNSRVDKYNAYTGEVVKAGFIAARRTGSAPSRSPRARSRRSTRWLGRRQR
ncbi:MAG: hypothetical protein WDO13_04360 [Verrucomicrobiota bacterium]